MASRKDHINKVIIPALNKGKIVICDRYVDSTAIYQGYYKKFGIKKILISKPANVFLYFSGKNLIDNFRKF